MALIVHGGITAEARENSPEALALVADAVAGRSPIGAGIDVRCALDGPVLSRDSVSFGMRLADHRRADLVDALGGYAPPSLEGALSQLATVPVVLVRIREPGQTADVIGLAREHLERQSRSYESLIISSSIPDVVAEVSQIDWRVQSALIVESSVESSASSASQVLARLNDCADTAECLDTARWILRQFDDSGATFLAPEWTLLSRYLLDGMGARRAGLVPWTVNDERLLVELSLREEVAHVMTDFPDIVFTRLRPPRPHRRRASSP